LTVGEDMHEEEMEHDADDGEDVELADEQDIQVGLTT
jgi:hypothetical protein